MNNYIFVFVILHYNLLEITKQCIESILSCIAWKNYSIVVVDNNSPDHSGTQLLNIYEKADRIFVLQNQSNIGFANGNNVGIEYAKKILNADFVCCINNDTIMVDSKFIEKSIDEYITSSAAVIGPQIICNDGSIQRKGRHLKSISEYKNYLLNIDAEYEPQKSTIKKLLQRIKIVVFLHEKLYCLMHEKRMEDVILHGCCLIFTPHFFNKLKGFNTKTFMYAEEELLYLSLKQNNLISVYNPKIKIKHLEDQSTDSICGTSEEKRNFIISNQINSLKVLINELENNKKY